MTIKNYIGQQVFSQNWLIFLDKKGKQGNVIIRILEKRSTCKKIQLRLILATKMLMIISVHHTEPSTLIC